MKILIAYVILLGLVIGKKECLRYLENNTLGNDNCAHLEYKDNIATLHLQACSNNKVCDMTFEKDYDKCEAYFSVPTKYPGEYCSDNHECISGKCYGDRCDGKNFGEACTSDLECNTTLYCNSSNFCDKALEKGNICKKDNFIGKCDAMLVCNNGICTVMGTLDIDVAADVPAACKSFYTINGACQVGPSLVRNPQDPSTGPTTCTNNVCKYKIKQETFDEICQCGKTNEGSEYCSPGRGEIDLQDYFNYAKKMYKAPGFIGCHVSKGPLCQYKKFSEMGIDFFKAYVAYNKMTRWVSFYNNPEFIKKILNYDYWTAAEAVNPQEDKGWDNWIYIVIAVVGAVILLGGGFGVYFFCIRKKSEEEEDESVTEDTTKFTP